MAAKPPSEPSREVTPEALYLRRREFIKNTGLFAATASGVGAGLLWLTARGHSKPIAAVTRSESPSATLSFSKAAQFTVAEPMTPFDDVTHYNNFYELGLSKTDPADNAATLRPRPWTVEISGEVSKPRTVGIDDLIGWFGLEERIYRMRCVEAWSMVIPWVGFPLKALLERVEPTSAARYVVFTTLLDSEQLPGQRQSVLDWPYIEGLRLDEALHPLAFLAVGLYGKPLLGQNGAPLRLVVPWKYGFKGIKSIVRITLTREQPATTWSRAASSEYGFYANVNPEVPHPRWSQATERRIGEFSRRKTLPFNGYGEQVASLYAGMNLHTFF